MMTRSGTWVCGIYKKLEDARNFHVSSIDLEGSRIALLVGVHI